MCVLAEILRGQRNRQHNSAMTCDSINAGIILFLSKARLRHTTLHVFRYFIYIYNIKYVVATKFIFHSVRINLPSVVCTCARIHGCMQSYCCWEMKYCLPRPKTLTYIFHVRVHLACTRFSSVHKCPRTGDACETRSKKYIYTPPWHKI